jgi:hypothetical protein
MGKTLLIAILAGAFAGGLYLAWRSSQDAPVMLRTPTCNVAVLDLSASPRPSQAAFWTQAFEKRIACKLAAGDALLVIGAHDNTDAAAPIYDKSTEAVDHDAGAEKVIGGRRALLEMRQGGMAKVRDAFAAPTRAATTRLVEALLRVPKGDGRAIRVCYFSDMVEDSRLINLARIPIGGRAKELARQVAKAAGLRGDELRGATVECVLDDLAIGERPQSVNSRAALRDFWQELFSLAGGNLVSFDARVGE